MAFQSYRSSLCRVIAVVFQHWVFTLGGQFQIIVSPGAVANQFLFPQSQATSWRFGTTAHLGLVRAKDTRSTELGSEEKWGAPPSSATPASQPEPGASDVVGS